MTTTHVPAEDLLDLIEDNMQELADDRAEYCDPDLKVDVLEARILLSATWVDADAQGAVDGVTAKVEGDVGTGFPAGLGGYDLLHGGDGNDSLFGDAANELISGEGGDDLLVGGSGDDVLIGGAGNDRLVGGDGDDVLVGGAGADQLRGGEGNDLLQGNGGSDTAIFSGHRADYEITANADGSVTVVDKRSVDGTDVLRDVESIHFADGTRATSDILSGEEAPFTEPDSSGSGSESTTIPRILSSGDQQRGDSSGGGSPRLTDADIDRLHAVSQQDRPVEEIARQADVALDATEQLIRESLHGGDLRLQAEIVEAGHREPTDWAQVDFGELHERSAVHGDRPPTASEVTQHDGPIDDEAMASQPADQETDAPSSFAKASKLGWLWGMLRAYGGARDEASDQTSRETSRRR